MTIQLAISVFVVLLSRQCLAQQDITTDRQFGCNWYGGSTPGVVCICHPEAEEMFIQNNIPGFDTSFIEINNCKNLRFGPRSISDMRNLRRISLTHIDNLQLEEKSLYWHVYREVSDRFDVSIPALKVYIKNSTVSKIGPQSFSGTINEINLDGVTIKEMQPFAFSSLVQTEKIVLKNCELLNIQQQPFKKFGTEILELENVRAKEIPSRTFSDVTVYRTFTITNCHFDKVRSGAFSVTNPETFRVTGSRIDQLDGEGFKVITTGDVLLRDNVFYETHDGSFAGIRLNREVATRGGTITFEGNTFTVLSRNSLSVQDFTAKFVHLNVNATCNCKSIDRELKESEFFSEIRCLHGGEYVTVRDFKTQRCSIISSYFTSIVIVCVVVGLLGLVGIGLLVYYRLVYRSRTYGSEKQSKKPGQLSLIVPDGRTYRETELHVIVERTDLLTTDL